MAKAEIVDSYDANYIQSRLNDYKLVYYMDEVDTTMRLAEEHARAKREFPALFLTDHQTNGIGREGRIWKDNPGSSILATGLFNIDPSLISIFGDLVTLRACDTIARAGISIGIKYPNDLVIGDKKVGGILVRNVFGDSEDSARYFGTMVGIGINVHYTEDELADYPTDYGATALDLHTASPNSRQDLLVAIFKRFTYLPADARAFKVNSYSRNVQNQNWRRYSTILKREVSIESGEKIFIEGMVTDTQIGNGILVNKCWFSQFDTTMKVRLLD